MLFNDIDIQLRLQPHARGRGGTSPLRHEVAREDYLARRRSDAAMNRPTREGGLMGALLHRIARMFRLRHPNADRQPRTFAAK